jgi:CheY-like chemotaxis protein
MSHELRTPLNSLLILAEQLEANPDRNMTIDQVEYASVIRSSGEDLLSLLNNILDLAKIESGTVSVEMTDLSLGQLRNTLLREFEHVAHGKGLGYFIDLAPGSPEAIVTDPQRLRQILKNLLSNALKFTERGEVRLRIGLAETGWSREFPSLARAPSVVALSVSDTGIGIEEDQHEMIFEAFAQGDGTTARLYGGTGLGLSISRELAGLLGGEITVASTPGQGSTFTVYLPSSKPAPRGRAAGPVRLVPVPERPRTLAKATDGPPSDGRKSLDFGGIKVLVVDDDFRNIFAMTALLERGHAQVVAAENGADAIAALQQIPDMDLVLMDVMMPVMDGYTTMRAIRKLPQFQSLPIIAVSGKVMPGERQRCLDAGANDFIPKPVDSAELFAVLECWLPAVTPAP